MDRPLQSNEQTTTKQVRQKISESKTSDFNISEMKNMIRDVVRDTVKDVVREELKQAGMIVESTSNSNETIQFKVGQHLFIGKVTKIKKLEK
jgi:CRISPR/Cas system CMR subunit Cmr6 (Cas7 group RAMP superfamily)